MRFSMPIKVLVILAGLLAGGSNAALALAHGTTHAREAQSTTRHHHVPAQGDHREGPQMHPSDTHGHTVLQIASTKRIGGDVVGPPAPALAAVPCVADCKRAVSPSVQLHWAGDHATGPPSRTRAPPLP